MIVLDTNLLSELMRPPPALVVSLWVEQQVASDLYISAITMAQILHGIERLPPGKRRSSLLDAARGMFEEDFADRIRQNVWPARGQLPGKPLDRHHHTGVT